MIFEFGRYTVDIDVEKTSAFYAREKLVSEVCSCDGCLNFEKAVCSLPRPVKAFFADLGIDMRKVSECYVNCAIDDTVLFYGGFYHVCGVLSAKKDGFRKNRKQRRTSEFSVSPDFRISFRNAVDLLEPGFPLPVIQLDFTANIPWVLEKENTY